MTRGRKPKPAATRKLGGNAGKRPLPPEVETGGVVRPPPPRHIRGRKARDLWRELVDELADAKLLTKLDTVALEMLVRTLIGYRAAAADLEARGYIVWTETNASRTAREANPALAPVEYPAANPNFSVMNKLGATAAKMLAEFGMTPSSRTRVEPAKGAAGESPFEKLAREARASRTKA